MNRCEAISLGLATYSTGKPCRNGHLSDRYAKWGSCIECVKLQTVKWRNDNPEKHKASMRKWWDNNKDLHDIRVRRWQKNNADKVRENQKQWAKDNPEKAAAKNERYRRNHPDRILALAVEGQLRRAKRVPIWLSESDKAEIRIIYKFAREMTKAYGFKWEVDHIIPLRGESVSGLHIPSNLQVIPKEVNRRKRNCFLEIAS